MSSQASIKRPGFGLLLNDHGADRFEHAIDDEFTISGVTLREKAMLDFVNQITDKPRWWEKVHDEAIVARWRSECGTEEQQRHEANFLDLNCFNYCMAELRDKAAYYQQHGIISVLDVMARIVKADPTPTDPFWDSLRQGVEPLENVRDNLKDWHPGSDGRVLDLVHPSLFPLEYGKTRVLPNDIVPRDNCAAYTGMGETCSSYMSSDGKPPPYLSTHQLTGLRAYGSYQWLPSDVTFDDSGSATIGGYINNLHPEQHAQLYPVMAKAVEKAIPLWKDCLAFPRHLERLRIRVERCGYEDFELPDDHTRSDWNVHDWVQDDPDQLRLIQPTVTEGYVPFAERGGHAEAKQSRQLDLIKDFPEGLQIIFKLANIHLTPEKPTYTGSNWHVEGALNEHICATALFYYDQENIEDSHLEFRQRIDHEEMMMKPEQNEYQAAERMFGIEEDGESIQPLGRVLTRSHRIIAFPNVLQHRVTPFSLEDRSKPGHRKILAMFLVDPHIRVLSTSNVPPQRLDWWAERVRRVPPFSNLPVEIFDQVVENVEEFPVGWEKACEVREALMVERGKMNRELDEDWQESTFSFCEH